MLHIGFTGSQYGANIRQLESLAGILSSKTITLHHGDCIGADEQAHALMLVLHDPAYIVVHPPDKDDKRAFCELYTEIWEPKPYLERDWDIAKEGNILVATPSTDYEVVRSGTWATIRYGWQLGKLVLIVCTDGVIRPYTGREQWAMKRVLPTSEMKHLIL